MRAAKSVAALEAGARMQCPRCRQKFDPPDAGDFACPSCGQALWHVPTVNPVRSQKRPADKPPQPQWALKSKYYVDIEALGLIIGPVVVLIAAGLLGALVGAIAGPVAGGIVALIAGGMFGLAVVADGVMVRRYDLVDPANEDKPSEKS